MCDVQCMMCNRSSVTYDVQYVSGSVCYMCYVLCVECGVMHVMYDMRCVMYDVSGGSCKEREG